MIRFIANLGGENDRDYYQYCVNGNHVQIDVVYIEDLWEAVRRDFDCIRIHAAWRHDSGSQSSRNYDRNSLDLRGILADHCLAKDLLAKNIRRTALCQSSLSHLTEQKEYSFYYD